MSAALALAPGRCVAARMPQASCTACIEACPHAALSTAPGGIALAPEACSRCGHCVATCPLGALSLPATPSPVLAEEAGVALVACARAPQAPAEAAPCAQALGLGDLARLWLGGVRVLALATGDCATCPEAPRAGLAERLAQLNALLAARGLAPLQARVAPAALLMGARPVPGRRALLGLGRTAHPSAPRDPAAALAALQHLPAAVGRGPALFAFAPGINASRCTGCDACIRICPTQALIRVKDARGEMRYATDPAACTGCGLCKDICDKDAVDLRVTSEVLPEVPLHAFVCRSCRAEAVHPQPGFAAEALCPACRTSGHHRAPVVVLR